MTTTTRIEGKNFTQEPRLVSDQIILKNIPESDGTPDGYGDVAVNINDLQEFQEGIVDGTGTIGGVSAQEVADLRGDLAATDSEVLIAGVEAQELVARTEVVASLKQLRKTAGVVQPFESIVSGSGFGGGDAIYYPDMSGANHNGGTVWAAAAVDAWDGTQEDLPTLLDYDGDDDGCYVRQDVSEWRASYFGVSPTLSPSVMRTAINKFHSMPSGQFNFDIDGTFITDGPVSFEARVNCSYDSGNADIRSNDISQAAFRLSGRYLSKIKLPTIGFDPSIPLTYGDSTNASAVGVLFTGLARSEISMLRIRHVGVGWAIEQSEGYGYTDQNALFSVTINMIDINDVSYRFFDATPWQGGNTGNVFINTYLNNKVNGVNKSLDQFFVMATTTEAVFSELNMEHALCNRIATFSSDVDTFNVGALHIEGISLNDGTRDYFYFNNNTLATIDSFVMVYNTFEKVSVGDYSIFRIGRDVIVNIASFKERNTTLTAAPDVSLVRYGHNAKSRSIVNIAATADPSIPDLFSQKSILAAYKQPPVLNVTSYYPLDGTLTVSDASLSWNPTSPAQRNILFVDQTTTRTFTVNNSSPYDGAECTIYNGSSSYSVTVSAGGLSFSIPVNSGTSLRCDGTNWYKTILNQRVASAASLPTGTNTGTAVYFSELLYQAVWTGYIWSNGGYRAIGSTVNRPSGIWTGFRYYDTTLSSVVIWDGSVWV